MNSRTGIYQHGIIAVAVAVAVAVAGISSVASAPSRPSAVRIADIRLTTGEQDIVIDFVRHGQTTFGNNEGVAGEALPGSPLSALGQQQAADVGNAMFHQFGGPDGVAGIFVGQNQRMGETAAPFADLEHMDTQTLAGLNEIGGGIFAHDPSGSLGVILSSLNVAAWVLGLDFVPRPGSNDYNGVQFDENMGSAVATMYQDALADPVVSADGQITDVAFSGDGAITAWILMNAKNPDLAIFLPIAVHALSSGSLTPEGGQDIIEGNPTDGWTLISFAGQPIPQDPGLLTELFVAGRSVLTAPQTAVYNLFEAVLTGDPTTIGGTLENSLGDIGATLVRFPGSVIGDIVDEVRNLGGDLAAGETFGDAFGSAILGLA